MDKARVYFFMVCLGLMTAATIGYATDPAIIDDQVGIYNFPWMNATIGVNAPDYYRDGVNFTAWVEAEIAAAGGGSSHTHDQDLNTTDDVTFASVDTGQGAYELYAMDQDVESTDAVVFATVDTGQGAGELYPGDQYVNTTSDVQFNGAQVNWLKLDGDNRTTWPSGTSLNVSGIGPDYIISRDGSYTIAANSTGHIVYNNTATTSEATFQSCSDDLSSGGWIHARQGTYTFSSTWVLHSGLRFSGVGGEVEDGLGTIIEAANNLDENIIEFNTTTTDYHKAIVLENFAIDGNSGNQGDETHGIYAWHAVRCIFNGIEVRYLNGSGLYIDGYSATPPVIRSYHNKISACNFMSCVRGLQYRSTEENDAWAVRTGSCDYGAYIASNINTFTGGLSLYDTVGFQIQGDRNTLQGVNFDRNDHEAIVITGKTQVKILGCHFHGIGEASNNTYAVIRGIGSTYITITGCTQSTAGTDPWWPSYIVHLDAGTEDYWLIKNNDFRAWGTAWILKDGGAGANNIESDNWT